MEATLKQLLELNKSNKYPLVGRTSQDALDLLEDKAAVNAAQPYQLRSQCLSAFQAALETKNVKLSSCAVAGMHNIFKDERFMAVMESEKEEHWLPVQVLTALQNTASFPDDVQIDVMKLLLNMVHSSSYCMNAAVIIRISNLCFNCISVTSRNALRDHIVSAYLRILHLVTLRMPTEDLVTLYDSTMKQVMVESYSLGNAYSVRAAVKATFTQLLTALAERLVEANKKAEEELSSSVSEFSSNNSQSEMEGLTRDVLTILTFLCDKLGVPINNQSDPLLLEGLLSIISKIPPTVAQCTQFHDLVWQKLCPSLISILANPVADKSVVSLQRCEGGDEVGRGSGCSSTSPSLHSSHAKTINSIAVELVRTVGQYASLRPVLESLFHRLLLYPPPVHRLDAVKALRPLLSTTKGLLILSGPLIDDSLSKPNTTSTSSSSRKKHNNELNLFKLILDSLQECCHCNDSSVAIASIDLVNDLLTSVETFIRGQGIPVEISKEIDSERLNSSSTKLDNDVNTNNHQMSDEVIPNGLNSTQGSTEIPNKMADDNCMKNNATEDKNSIKKSSDLYVERLKTTVRSLVNCMSAVQCDQTIQEFSSQFFDEIATDRSRFGSDIMLNADAVYITTYSVLQLCYKLHVSGYHTSKEKSLPYSEQQFIDEVCNTGLLLFISREFLVQIFHWIISVNLFSEFDIDQLSSLVTLLTDIDGLNSRRVGGQLMTAYQDSSNVSDVFSFVNSAPDGSLSDSQQSAVQTGTELAHKILTVGWNGIIDVLSVLITGRAACGITISLSLMFNAKEETRRAREAICTSLEGLQRAARLSCILGVQERCSAIFAQLAAASCVLELEGIKKERQQQSDKKSLTAILPSTNRPKLAKLHAAHALSMDVLLSIGLEMGSHAADCWIHVFTCCSHISELEHTYFSQGNNQSNIPRLQQEQNKTSGNTADTFNTDDLDLGCPADTMSTMSASAEPMAPVINVSQIVHQSRIESGWDSSVASGGVLNPSQASKVLCGLSQQVDKLFDDAAYKLNMKALLGFLSSLCDSSRNQLSAMTAGATCDPATIPQNALHLYRLSDVMTKCVRSDRPLIHIMQAWNIVSQHLIEAAGHRDRSICKKAVDCIHDIVTSLLSCCVELPHFHLNESLCKPFESLLCLELCDVDVQDQIVCSICELIEASTTNIKSGWKPLFGALRAVRIEYTANEEINSARQRHVTNVLDVFEVFLGSDNVLVFSNAAIDCVLCLLKYVSGPGGFEKRDADDSDEDDFVFDDAKNLCLPALQYLKQCAHYIASMWQMSNCPVFSGAHRIRTDKYRPIDLNIPNVDIEAFRKLFQVKEDQIEKDDNCDNESVTSSDISTSSADEILSDNDDVITTAVAQVAAAAAESAASTADESSEPAAGNVSTAAETVDAAAENVSTVAENVNNTAENVNNTAENVNNAAAAAEQDTSKAGSEINAVTSEPDQPVSLNTTNEQLLHSSTEAEKELIMSNGTNDKIEINNLPADLNSQPIAADSAITNESVAEVPKKGFCDEALLGLAEVSVDRRAETLIGGRSHGLTNEIVDVTLFKQLDELDNNTRALHVYFLIIEGLAGAISACPKNYQPQALELLFELMRSIAQVPGSDFALYCLDLLILPTLQTWVRHGSNIMGYWDNTMINNFKQYAGLCVDLVVEYIIQFIGQSELMCRLEQMLKQQLHVLVECIAQPIESLSRLGCACMRHCLMNCGPILTEQMWQICANSMQEAFEVTLYPLQQLMTPFHENSDNFYGDVGQVKVAVRLDCTAQESKRLEQLAHQVFLLDTQRISGDISEVSDKDTTKSFVFLICNPSGDDSTVTRIPLRNLVVSLLSHQMLVQTIGGLMLRGSDNHVNSERVMIALSPSTSRRQSVAQCNTDSFIAQSAMPGMLGYMSSRNVCTFLQCLRTSFHVAFQFDARPGLKFLVQKVSRTDVAANMYKQSGVSMTVYLHVLLEIVSRQDNLCSHGVKKMLEELPASRAIKQTNKNQDADKVKSKSKRGKEEISNKQDKEMEERYSRVQEEAQVSVEALQRNMAAFVCLLKEAFDEACSRYVSVYLEKEGPNIADRLSQSLLVFLLAQPEELPSLKRDKSLKEMVAEKLQKSSGESQARRDTQADTAPSGESEKIRAQSVHVDVDSLAEVELIDPIEPSVLHKHRPQAEDRVYNVAGEKMISDMMNEYRKRKQVNSMPSRQATAERVPERKSATRRKSSKEADPVEREIEEQQRSSIMKDSEARLRSWVEVLCNALQLLHQLPDDQYCALLPAAFSCVQQLVAYSKDAQLRQALSQWTLRVGKLFQFCGPNDHLLESTNVPS